MIRVIAAMAENNAIGKDNKLLWNIPGDLKNFKQLTTGHTVVMGRKTYESIGRALPGRRNIVITRTPDYRGEDIEIASSFDKAMEMCFWSCFIIGGAEIYKHALPLAEKLYLTIVDGEFNADTYFPEFGTEWIKISEKPVAIGEDGDLAHRYVEFEKCKF